MALLLLLLQQVSADAAATVASIGLVNGDSLTVREKPAPPAASAAAAAGSAPSAVQAPSNTSNGINDVHAAAAAALVRAQLDTTMTQAGTAGSAQPAMLSSRFLQPVLALGLHACCVQATIAAERSGLTC